MVERPTLYSVARSARDNAPASAQVPEVGLELGDHGEGLQEQPPERVVPVVDGCAQSE
ncbi:hypothetical protein [Nonomuraea jabiensis]|uniref:Uncharacterized protein n=1 Tax=Nonomuraea jabiensis TaxID=882448 RepID=A0A7W9GDH9_9ACTN|nr:hypothetical protein [Nonomuraea jabiensis]MBB5781711.1 hypothetical protein [Nonomuraea jabiensis]